LKNKPHLRKLYSDTGAKKQCNADIGILSCEVGESCVAGYCANPQQKKMAISRRAEENAADAFCNPDSPNFAADDFGDDGFFDCDCSGVNMSTGLGILECSYESYCMDDDYNYCADIDLTVTFTGPEDYTYKYCYDFADPYHLYCITGHSDYSTCSISINNEYCETCVVATTDDSCDYGYDYFFSAFDCTNLIYYDGNKGDSCSNSDYASDFIANASGALNVTGYDDYVGDTPTVTDYDDYGDTPPIVTDYDDYGDTPPIVTDYDDSVDTVPPNDYDDHGATDYDDPVDTVPPTDYDDHGATDYDDSVDTLPPTGYEDYGGDTVVLIRTEETFQDLVMDLFGVSDLSEAGVDAWITATKEYLKGFYEASSMGMSNVVVDIRVVAVIPADGRRRHTRGRALDKKGSSKSRSDSSKSRSDDEGAVEVVFDQTTSFDMEEGSSMDTSGLALMPFSDAESRENYVGMLQSMDGLEGITTGEMASEEEATNKKKKGKDKDSERKLDDADAVLSRRRLSRGVRGR
jgi:hypothetical protein